MRTLVNRFRNATVDSKTENYISTVAHCASLSCECKATERYENMTSRPITYYHAYRKYTSTERIPLYSGPAAVVLSTVLANEKFQLQTTIRC